MSKLSKEEVISQIIKASIEQKEDACMMVALAHIETGGTFNNMANRAGKYLGVFQMSNGYGGVKGNDRYNPYLATLGTIKAIRSNRDSFNTSGLVWKPFYAYLTHQQGLAGAKGIAKSAQLGHTIATYGAETKRGADVLLNNAKRTWGLNKSSKVSAWLSYWEADFAKLMATCTYACPMSGLANAGANEGNDVNSGECGYNVDGQLFKASKTDISKNNFGWSRNYYI